jgi:ABC-type branched-subunit amino acid transport system ATPase component
MIRSLSIQGYRAFAQFSMENLGQINLIVGTNNSGKTSVLEALHLLSTNGDPSVIWRNAAQRGERFEAQADERRRREVDISHLFHGHELRPDSVFSIFSDERFLEFKATEATAKEDLFSGEEDVIIPRMVLSITGRPEPIVSVLPLSRQGGFSLQTLDSPRRPLRVEQTPALFVSTESLSAQSLTSHWNRIVLTPTEEIVLRALKFLEPRIERIASISEGPLYYRGDVGRGSFVVKLAHTANPIPIGSLGDGTWRMLALAIALSRASNGVLLVDEIDTGLHYTVMSDMWRLVDETAKLLNVQVFATSHSYDCVKSLSVICDSKMLSTNHVTIQRIDPRKRVSVAYTESEIRKAAEHHIEVR